jgi:hypothetical protein
MEWLHRSVTLIKASTVANAAVAAAVFFVSLLLLVALLDTNEVIFATVVIGIAVLSAAWIFRYFRSGRTQRESELRSYVDEQLSEKEPPVRAAAFQPLVHSDRHSRKADQSQFFLFLTLVVTATFMVFAGLIADIDNRVLNSSRDLASQRDSVAREISRAESDLLDQMRASVGDDRRTIEEIYRRRLESLNAYLRDLQNSQIKALELVAKRDEQVIDQDRRLVSATVLRISFSAVAIFLVIILLRNHRYHTMASAVYASKFNALCLGGINTKEFIANSTALTAENVPFGRDPRHPFTEAVDAATSLFRPRNKKPERTQDAPAG